MTRIIFVVILTSTFLGCYRAPDPDDISDLDFGSQPSDPLSAIRSYMKFRLFDEDSAKYECDPVKPVVKKRLFASDRPFWSVTCLINAKNRFGGYVGFQRYRFLFKENGLLRWY